MADGSIVFKTKIDTSGLTPGAKKVAQVTNEVIREAEKASAKSSAEVKKQAKEVADLSAKMKHLREKDPRTKKYAAATDRAEDLKGKIFGMEQQRSGIFGNTFGATKQREELTAQIREAKKELADLLKQIAEMENSGQAFTDVSEEVSKVTKELKGAEDRLVELKKREAETADASKKRVAEAVAEYQKVAEAERRAAAERQQKKEGGDAIGAVFGQAGMQIAGAMSGDVLSMIGLAKTGLDTIGGILRRIGDGLKTVLKRFGQLVKKLFTGNGQLKRLTRRIVSLTASALLFNKLSRAMTEISNSLTTVLEKNAGYNAALGKLKGNVVAAFAPIWNIAVPALTSLINLLARAAGLLAQFSAVLSGGTVAGAEAAASALWAQAGAADAAGGAAEDAKRQLAGFDDLTRLDEPGGGGGGSSSGAFAPDIGNGLVDLLEKKDFSALGKQLGKKLAEAFGAAAEYVKWDNISPKISKGLNGFLDFINSFFSEGDPFAPLGTAIGNGIRSALLFAGTIAEGVDWSAITTGLGRGINNAVARTNWIDWVRVKKKLKNGCENIATGLNDGIAEIKWSDVGAAIGDGLATAVDLLTTTVDTIDWMALGNAVRDMIIYAIDEIDNGEIGDALNAAIDAGVDFFAGMDMGTIAAKIVKAIIDALWATRHDIAMGLAEVFFAAVSLSIAPIGGPIGVAAAQIGKLIVQGLLNGILGETGEGSTFWERFKEPFVNAIELVKDIFGIRSPSTVFEAIGRNVLLGFVNGILGTRLTLKGALNSMISTLESWANLCIRAVNSVISALNKIRLKIPPIPGITSGLTISPSIAPVGSITIPRLARGAVIPPNREFIAVLGDQHSGNNLEAPEGLIRRIVREEAGNTDILMEILSAVQANQVIVVNGKVLGETVRTQLARDARASGTDLVFA